jgi:DNA segregation ATPase FtsK/SpoIIIE-like protein
MPRLTPSPPRRPPRAPLRAGLLALLFLAGAGASAMAWPWVGWAWTGVVGWWGALLTAAGLRPRWLLRAHLWLGLLALAVVGAGALALYREGWGGRLGEEVAGPSPWTGVPRLLGMLAVALSLLFPRATGRLLHRAARRGIRYLRRLYRRWPPHRMAWQGVSAAARLARGWWRRWRRRGEAPSGEGEYPSLRERRAPRPRGHPHGDAPTQEDPGPAVRRPAHALGGWKLPSLALLAQREERAVSEEEVREKARLIERTLADYNIEATVVQVRPGPVVTLFGLVPGWVRKVREVRERDREGRPKVDKNGRPLITSIEQKTRVKVDTILQREKDLAMALAAPSIRFEAPVPGESFIGLEVPNSQPAVVTLRSVMESEEFRQAQRKGHLPIALGKGSGGEVVVADLTEMPHLLIAGATGSGKSVCINAILCCLLMQFTPFDLRLLLTDPKRVEMTPYNGIPHLVRPVVVEGEEAVPLLRALVHEMRGRYKRLEAAGVRHIQGFNAKMRAPQEKMPYLVVVIDELADLMMAAPVEVEQSLCRLAQLGRAVGIHLIVATQRPSVDVITGLIKANFPSRISFAVSSQVDSRTILDMAGAEKLLGKGDMLFLPVYLPKPKRLQGVFVSDEEVNHLVEHWRSQKGPSVPPLDLVVPHEEDELVEKAKALAQRHGHLSVSLLQRKLGIGHARAVRLMEHLESMGVTGKTSPSGGEEEG